MILKQRRDGTTEPYTAMQMSKIVRKLRDRLALPSTFTLDACRHGGMTELEEAELTDGQGRARLVCRKGEKCFCGWRDFHRNLIFRY
jgi:hypothetical protein